ncbi:MAG TPA: hypothetical protein PLC04_08010 [Candidatus Kapabacteria bacterium]|nr:hypothetical protein [Candidatus Kapabacteria bacterium]
MKNLGKYTWILAIVGLALLIALLKYAPGFAVTGEAFLITGLFAFLFGLFDKYVLPGDLSEQIIKGNNYGLTLIAISVIFLAAVLLVR